MLHQSNEFGRRKGARLRPRPSVCCRVNPAGLLPARTPARTTPARLLSRAAAGSPLACRGGLARRRRSRRFGPLRGGPPAGLAALLRRALVGLAATAGARLLPAARHRVLGGPSATSRLFPGHAPALIPLFYMPS